MTLLRIVRKKNYTVVPNHIIRDKDLSLQAKMIMVTYLSNKDGIEVSNAYIESTCTNGRISVASAVDELIAAGYYRRDKYQAEHGHWHTSITITTEAWQFEDDLEDPVNEQSATAPSDGSPTARNLTVGERTAGNTAGKRVSTKEKQLFLTSGAGASDQPNQVSAPHRPARKRSGLRRQEVAENSPSDTGRTIGVPATTSRAVRSREERQAISRPNSGGGLAREFSIRAGEAGLGGPQEVNAPALARSLTRWMQDGTNPDTPDRIRSMFDQFFDKPGGGEDYPLWRRFLSEGPRLRNTERKSQPIDYGASADSHQRWLEKQAAAGDIRAEQALSGENMPWMSQK